MRKLTVSMCAALIVGLAGCSSDGMITVSARFADIGDLAVDAPVMLADIDIGSVTDVHLAGYEAVVEMEIEKDAGVPDGVIARVRRTSVLGERIVDLVVPEDLSAGAPLLEDGAQIDETVVRSDLEDLVDEGSQVLGAISATDLAIMIDEGAKGFGGQGQELRGLLQNFDRIVAAYADRSDALVSLIDSVDRFNSTLATRADAHRRAIANTARSIEVLQEESEELEQAILSLDRLAIGSRSILAAHSDEMGRFFSQMNRIMGALRREQRSIRLALKWAPGHNENTQRVEYTEFNQVVQEFVICGLNDNPDDPARRCRE